MSEQEEGKVSREAVLKLMGNRTSLDEDIEALGGILTAVRLLAWTFGSLYYSISFSNVVTALIFIL